ncbi:L-ascorbate oxidase-like isoform X2 [Aphidius gifuensis]|uniref:L-ascorbate oxidase-like isoform X2 n=1 Tax=Aphidius gifuensis TaxID=684658 RepID=UPI001CDC259C|nr:L-ascorbate oxidase-like isoform X2 [Aphidius gifuensis]
MVLNVQCKLLIVKCLDHQLRYVNMVCQGDRIIVDVTNSLIAESTTLHWHGQHHRTTPYMDGVPYVTQCPIPPGATFRYHYPAATPGTHFWHSHSGFQRSDGVFGSLIVRIPKDKDPFNDLYDFDEHTIIILDWDHESGVDKFLAHHHSDGDNKPPTLLVNGLGRYQKLNDSHDAYLKDMPLEKFHVQQNFRYRFRLINAEFLNCPIEVSVDNHTIYIVATDGNNIEPVEVESFVTYAGERFDFIIMMDQDVGNYWMRFRGLMDCDKRFTSAHQVAILSYQGADDNEPNDNVAYDIPLSHPSFENQTILQLNSLNKGTESLDSISMPLLESLEPNDESNTREPDYQFYLSYDFYDKDNSNFHRKDLYGFHQVNSKKGRVYTPQLNHITMKLPSFPLLSQRELIKEDQFCNSSSVKNCKNVFCSCTHVLQVKLNSVVEVIMVDEGFTFDANHPFHLHGHNFRVVAMAKVGKNVTVKEVQRLDSLGLIKRRLERAPLKDTVTVPDGGYTVIRFHASNPGYSLMHCHLEHHSMVGMMVIFKIGTHEEMPPVPDNFPRCGDWKPQAPPEISSKKILTYEKTTTNDLFSENDVNGLLRNIAETLKSSSDGQYVIKHCLKIISFTLLFIVTVNFNFY